MAFILARVSDSIARLKAEFFRMLGHPARVRLLEVLGQGGERSVGDLQGVLAMESSTASQHLAALRKLGLVETRKEGASVFYRLKDPLTLELLDVTRRILTSNLRETQALLHELAPPPPRPRRVPRRITT